MTALTVTVLCGLVFVWAVLSAALGRHEITGPLLFATAGYLLANPGWGPLSVDIHPATVKTVAEVTLAMVLFADASRVNVTQLRHDMGLPGRLLVIALPLSVLAGAGLAAGLLTGLPWALAGFLGAALAPTDAALSADVISDRRIGLRIRRALNVESGLNDGIVTPAVTVMLAVAASQLGQLHDGPAFEAGVALRELAVGLGIGLAAGAGGALIISMAAARTWVGPGGRRLAALAVAVGAFAGALAASANGFIAAFVAGIAFGAAANPAFTPVEHVSELPALVGELLALVVWFLFGATLVPIAFGHSGGRTVAYAALSLTVVRMAPVALSLIGTGLDRPSVAFIGWFGPRGLASVVFALLALEELGPAADPAVAAVALTVVASVVLHGVTARPGGQRYAQRESAGAGPVVRRSSAALKRR